MNKKNQMNHKNKDVHIYSKYRLVFIFLYVFNNIYTHHKHLKIKKKKQKKMKQPHGCMSTKWAPHHGGHPT